MENISLAILCGGKSRRFGTDKGFFAPLGDESLVARAIRLLGEDFGEILVVVRDPEQELLYRAALEPHLQWAGEALNRKVRLVHDSQVELGSPSALTGIATALATMTKSQAVIVPVDQVGVRSLHLKRLVNHGEGLTYPVAFASNDQTVLPFPSLWRATHLPSVAARLTAQGLGVRATLADLNVKLVDEPSWHHSLAANTNTLEEAQGYFGRPLVDPYGRRLHYLRFSLTEACNLSCQYCLPHGFPEWYRHKARLGMDNVGTLARGFRLLGFRKLRLTGGEPTLHPHALEAVKLAHSLGYEEIAMTTNGLLMGDVGAWTSAGLTHLNVSLDSLDANIFQDMAGSRQIEDALKVRETIESAVASGIKVKVNTVLMRSRNGRETNIRALIEWALGLPLTLRFIELMDTKLNATFAAGERVFGREIEPILHEYGLSQVVRHRQNTFLGGPATEYGSKVHQGRIGLINPLSCNFCNDCNRLRVTARGGLKLCLFGNEDIPLDLTSPESVASVVRRVISQKPEKHYLEDGLVGNVATFRTIGG
jgi:cyclic pyranopterin phosphate synthase